MSALSSADFWAFVGVVAGIYAMFGLGVQLQYGHGGLMNFGQSAFMAIGAYAMVILTVDVGLSMWVASVIAVFLAAAVGVLLGLPCVRLRGDYLAITTLAFAEIVRQVATNEGRLTGGAQGTIAIGSDNEGAAFNHAWLRFQENVGDALGGLIGVELSNDATMLILVWAVVIVLVLVMQGATRSPWGRLVHAVRDDDVAATSLGKQASQVKVQVFALGAALGAIAGVFYAYQFAFFVPDDFAAVTTLFAWTTVIIGGLGRNWGVPVGALIFGVLFAGTRFLTFPPLSYLDSADRAYLRLMIIGLLIIALVAFRPQGLFGKRESLGFD